MSYTIHCAENAPKKLSVYTQPAWMPLAAEGLYRLDCLSFLRQQSEII